MPLSNYLAPLTSGDLSLGQKIQGMEGRKINLDRVMTAHDRSYGIQKIFDLHLKKEYRPESLFVACGIFDRYISAIGVLNFPKQNVVCLATISVLMSAKLE